MKQWEKVIGDDFPDDLNILIGRLCVEWGFCNQLDGYDLVVGDEPLTAKQFAKAVLRADGMNPDSPRWMPPVRTTFERRYGKFGSTLRFKPQPWPAALSDWLSPELASAIEWRRGQRD